MTDYLPYTEDEYSVGAPATSLHFERWFRNPNAIAEGAPGAPKVMGQALDTVLFIQQTGQVIITDLERVERILFFGALNHNNNENPVTISVFVNRSTDNGASWGPDLLLFQQSVAPNNNYRFTEIVNVTAAGNALRLRATGGSGATMTTSALVIQGVQP